MFFGPISDALQSDILNLYRQGLARYPASPLLIDLLCREVVDPGAAVMQTRRFATFGTRALAYAIHRGFCRQIKTKYLQEGIIWEIVDRCLVYTEVVRHHCRHFHRNLHKPRGPSNTSWRCVKRSSIAKPRRSDQSGQLLGYGYVKT
jgi:hypothetical protein